MRKHAKKNTKRNAKVKKRFISEISGKDVTTTKGLFFCGSIFSIHLTSWF